MSTKLEQDTFAGKTIQSWKDQATKAGLVLRAPSDVTDSGDFPDNVYGQLRRFRRIISKSKGEPKKIITHMARQQVNTRENGKPTKKEYLTYQGYYEVKDHRGVPDHANLEVGKYERPKIVANDNRKYNPDTGLPIGSEFIFAGQETIYTIEVPKSKTERKRMIDEIIGDNFPEEIKYYFKSHDELARRDSTFSYDEFVNYSIEELRNTSFKGGGVKSPGYYRTPDGKLRNREGSVIDV